MQDHNKNALGLLALSSVKGVGFETLLNIADQGHSFADIINLNDGEYASELLSRNGARIEVKKNSDWLDVKRRIYARSEEMDCKLKRMGVSIIFRSSAEYPKQLLDLPDAPHWLFVQGNTAVLQERSLGVVGTRKPSPEGLWLTNYVGHCLNDWGMPTVSGLALGIDQEIHRASLRARIPTIAFLGTGILSDYPRGSERLRQQIVAEGGAIVTEYLPNETYSAKNFVKRNRLQAALSSVLVPSEWSAKSGTAHTVGFAQRLHRKIALIRVFGQPSFDWVPKQILDASAQFTIPKDHNDFAKFLHFVEISQPPDSQQLSFF
jgi:DNA processing protein